MESRAPGQRDGRILPFLGGSASAQGGSWKQRGGEAIPDPRWVGVGDGGAQLQEAWGQERSTRVQTLLYRCSAAWPWLHPSVLSFSVFKGVTMVPRLVLSLWPPPTPTPAPSPSGSVGHPGKDSLCSPSSSPRGGSVFIFKSSFSCPGSSTWPLPGPIVSGPRAIRSSWGRTREPPTPISSHRLGLQVPDPALGQINRSAHKRHPGTDLRAARGSSRAEAGRGPTPRAFCSGCPGAVRHPTSPWVPGSQGPSRKVCRQSCPRTLPGWLKPS